MGSRQLEGEKHRQSRGAGDQGPCREEQSGGGRGEEEGTGLLGNLGCCCEVGDNLSWSPGRSGLGTVLAPLDRLTCMFERPQRASKLWPEHAPSPMTLLAQ